MTEAIVLDTSAILTFTGKEPGAEDVKACFEAAIVGRAILYSSFVTRTEVEYIA